MKIHDHIRTVILSNLKPPAERRVGVEIEYLIYDQEFRRLPVNPGQHFAATDLLARLDTWQKDSGLDINYSLEPGGQLEYASAPFASLHAIKAQHDQHRQQMLAVCREHKLQVLDLALEPLYPPRTIELIDLQKYRLMHAWFRHTGTQGAWMMRNTASVQVNIDFSSETEAQEMAFIADCLEPVCAWLFANSPFMDGQPAGRNNLRYHIWSDTDSSRCGGLWQHGMHTPEGLLDNYARWVASLPLIYTLERDGTATAFPGTCGDWLRSRQRAEGLAEAEVQAVLHQVFTHVRFKHVLEIRGADRPPAGWELAPAAFWLGLLTVEPVRARVLEKVSGWTRADRQRLRRLAEQLEPDRITPAGPSLRELTAELCEWSCSGLDQRARELNIPSERPFLEDFLKAFAAAGPFAWSRQQQYHHSRLPLLRFLSRECHYET